MDSIVIEQGLERWEIPKFELSSSSSNVVKADITTDGNTVKIKLKEDIEENCRYLVVMAGEDLRAYYFDSVFSPLYASYFSVIEEISSLSSFFTPHMVYSAIRDSSLFIENYIDIETPVQYAVQQYVKYAAAYKLLSQLALKKDCLSGEDFQLDDLRVKYTSKSFTGDIRQKLIEWERRLGLVKARTAVKGGTVNGQPVNSRSI